MKTPGGLTMKRLVTTSLLLLFTTLLFGWQATSAQSASWTAEYFNNASLAGAPVVVRAESSPSNNWGYGSPAPQVPPDYFSARWATTAYVEGGSYLLTIRADDGVRVLIDGIPYLERWSLATGETYQVNVNLGSGNHIFVVEFYEATEVAFLDYSFTLAGSGPIVPPPSGITATVTAYTLNVRSAPNAWAQILTRIYQGQSYSAIGRNADVSWVLLNINGTLGWVNRSYVSGSGFESLPLSDGGQPTPPPPPPVGVSATVTAYALNVRNAPNPYTGVILTRIYRNQTYSAVGRNVDASWVQLNVNGTVGWVNRSYVSGFGFESLPVTDYGTQPPPVTSTATVRAYFLNVRNTSTPFGTVLTIISRGQSYPVVGRNGDASWVQLNVNGTIGWVNRGWVTVTSLNVPVTG
jgi:uncharacterized protein YgiM (DUF1202 family)